MGDKKEPSRAANKAWMRRGGGKVGGTRADGSKRPYAKDGWFSTERDAEGVDANVDRLVRQLPPAMQEPGLGN